ncbi:unnamed protein product [Rhodiola kirilowii]
MAASSTRFATPFTLRRREGFGGYKSPSHQEVTFQCFSPRAWKADDVYGGEGVLRLRCPCPDLVTPRVLKSKAAWNSTPDEWQSGWTLNARRVTRQAQSRFVKKHERFYTQCASGNAGPKSRDTPPKRNTGIANEKDWGISMLNEPVKESGTNEDGSTWYRESREDIGENGYRCRRRRMGGRNHDGTSEWKETWWEKSDWTGYRELGVEKSGRNTKGDSWWETWQESLHQDEWSNLLKIERSAQKQAKSITENAEWFEKWWEKYDGKGWTEKGAHKYGRLNENSWWEKWGELYDRGFVHKWTDKWAEAEQGTKWGDKWEESFIAGIGGRQGETWHLLPTNDRWSRTWGEEHSGDGQVHKFGRSTAGERWDIVVDEETNYEPEPHYGWADVVADSSQLLSIKAREKPLGMLQKIASSIKDDPDQSTFY